MMMYGERPSDCCPNWISGTCSMSADWSVIPTTPQMQNGCENAWKSRNIIPSARFIILRDQTRILSARNIILSAQHIMLCDQHIKLRARQTISCARHNMSSAQDNMLIAQDKKFNRLDALKGQSAFCIWTAQTTEEFKAHIKTFGSEVFVKDASV